MEYSNIASIFILLCMDTYSSSSDFTFEPDKYVTANYTITEEKESVSINCNLTSDVSIDLCTNENCSIKWYKDGHRVNSTVFNQTCYNASDSGISVCSSTLEWTNPNEKDICDGLTNYDGMFYCNFTTDDNRLLVSGAMDVRANYLPYDCGSPDDEIIGIPITEGSVRLQTSFKARPEDISYKWFDGDGTLIENAHSESYTIDNISSSDDGTYICQATNFVNSNNKTISLELRDEPNVTLDNVIWVGTTIFASWTNGSPVYTQKVKLQYKEHAENFTTLCEAVDLSWRSLSCSCKRQTSTRLCYRLYIFEAQEREIKTGFSSSFEEISNGELETWESILIGFSFGIALMVLIVGIVALVLYKRNYIKQPQQSPVQAPSALDLAIQPYSGCNGTANDRSTRYTDSEIPPDLPTKGESIRQHSANGSAITGPSKSVIYTKVTKDKKQATSPTLSDHADNVYYDMHGEAQQYDAQDPGLYLNMDQNKNKKGKHAKHRATAPNSLEHRHEEYGNIQDPGYDNTGTTPSVEEYINPGMEHAGYDNKANNDSADYENPPNTRVNPNHENNEVVTTYIEDEPESPTGTGYVNVPYR